MGTRADFYVGRGQNATWLGSIAWDGYPEGITPVGNEWPGGVSLFDATTEGEFRARLALLFDGRKDVTLPAQGWPWPWKDSRTTDYAYAFHDGKVIAWCFGKPFDIEKRQDANDEDWDPPKDTFPNMEEDSNVSLGGPRSGLIVITSEK